MGNVWPRTSNEKQVRTDLFLERAVLYGGIIPGVLLGLLGLIVFNFVTRLECYPSHNVSRIGYSAALVEDYCWTHYDAYEPRNFTNGSRTYTEIDSKNKTQNITENYEYVYSRTSRSLPHKYLSILLLVQAATLLIPWIFWRASAVEELKTSISAILWHCNNLTKQYQHFEADETDELTISENIDGYLECLHFLLRSKMRKLYWLYFVKCVLYFAILLAWFIGFIFLVAGNFASIFERNFWCLFDPRIDTYLFQRYQTWYPLDERYVFIKCSLYAFFLLIIIWCINVVLLGILLLTVLIHMIVDLCIPSSFDGTFMHQTVPGAADDRLAQQIQGDYASQYYGLFSKFCTTNAGNFLDNYAVSQSITAKNQLLYDSENDEYYRKGESCAPILTKGQVARVKKRDKSSRNSNSKSKSSKGSKSSTKINDSSKVNENVNASKTSKTTESTNVNENVNVKSNRNVKENNNSSTVTNVKKTTANVYSINLDEYETNYQRAAQSKRGKSRKRNWGLFGWPWGGGKSGNGGKDKGHGASDGSSGYVSDGDKKWKNQTTQTKPRRERKGASERKAGRKFPNGIHARHVNVFPTDHDEHRRFSPRRKLKIGPADDNFLEQYHTPRGQTDDENEADDLTKDPIDAIGNANSGNNGDSTNGENVPSTTKNSDGIDNSTSKLQDPYYFPPIGPIQKGENGQGNRNGSEPGHGISTGSSSNSPRPHVTFASTGRHGGLAAGTRLKANQRRRGLHPYGSPSGDHGYVTSDTDGEVHTPRVRYCSHEDGDDYMKFIDKPRKTRTVNVWRP
ncbi:uncharacterized protein LOC106169282 [Lingula anatina]|uniref:Uncharacterized protein LOC106169282 n=1 Tax=Lingula anatina TaxID=7574 RepID=A0A1S3J134_LINAN|nr:uncharacterized protein LOC106169282 [Lingula anatina]|eukprot:XP_013404150.1 uncharacterized protein LOC106169282 [Lingula anatina]